MQKQFLSFFLAFFLGVLSLDAQENSTCKAPHDPMIKQTIQMYFDGWMTGDTSKVGKAMHSTCHLKFIKDGVMGIRDRTKYLSGFKPRPRLENSEGRIIKIDRTGDVASAKCEIEIPGRLFTDYFNMMKIDGQWYIVDKISTSVEKE